MQNKISSFAKTTPNSDSLLRETDKIIDKKLILLMLNHSSYNDKFRKVFSVSIKNGGLGSLLPEDRAEKWGTFVRLCSVSLQNYSVVDTEFYK